MTARDWFAKAQSEGWAIGAFNVDNLDIFKAICEAAAKKKSPAMVEFSPGEVGYFGLKNIVDLVSNAREEYQIPILLNLDHAKKVEDCLAAIEVVHLRGVKAHLRGDEDGLESKPTSEVFQVGFDQVHFDGSELEFSENVEATKKVVAAAHGKDLLVEGEIDRISGASEVHNEDLDLEALKISYTNPERAAKFVLETGVDIYAAVFGNVHGIFPTQPDLDFDLLKKIREALSGTFLSMHGGSGIPAQLVREAIRVGKIVKINVNTEIRQAFRDALSEEISENPQQWAYYKLTPDVVEAVMAVVEAKIEVFGSEGKGGD